MSLYTKHKKTINETLFSMASVFVVALLFNFFIWQHKIISGGMVGYALFANYYTNVSTALIFFILNVILFILASILVGKGVGFRAVIGFTLLSIFLELTRLPFGSDPNESTDTILNIFRVLIVSISASISICIVLANNYSIGAYSTVYVIVSKFFKVKPHILFFSLDFVLTFITILLFGVEKGLIIIINALAAYFIIKLLYPHTKIFFTKFNS